MKQGAGLADPRDTGGMTPVTERPYRMVFVQDDKVDHLSEIPLTAAEAFEQLGTSMALHIITGWTVVQCACGHGFHAQRDDVLRSEHVERLEGEDVSPALAAVLEDIPNVISDVSAALREGLLAPASHVDGLVGV